MFMSDLSRAIDLPVEFDFMAVSSYGSATRSSGVVRIIKDLDLDLTDRHVLIVEDIVDSGLTLAYLRKNLAARGPASLEVCALLVKEGLQRVELDLKYVGFRIPPDVRRRLRPRRRRALPQPALRSPSTSGPTELTRATDAQEIRAVERRSSAASSSAVREILVAIGEDPDRDGLARTPAARRGDVRGDLRAGSHEDPAQHLTVTFEADHDEMVMVRDIPLLQRLRAPPRPVPGRAHVAYIPGDDGRITGLSKIARLVDGFAKRPQVQERLTTQIADALVEVLEPTGVLRDDRGRAPLHVDARREEARDRSPSPRPCAACSRPTPATRAEAMSLITHPGNRL